MICSMFWTDLLQTLRGHNLHQLPSSDIAMPGEWQPAGEWQSGESLFPYFEAALPCAGKLVRIVPPQSAHLAEF